MIFLKYLRLNLIGLFKEGEMEFERIVITHFLINN